MRSKVKKTKFSLFKEVFNCRNNNKDIIILNSFVLDIEIHSYLPISRKILSSSFRYSKRKFKGQVVFENVDLNNLNSLSFLQKDFKIYEI